MSPILVAFCAGVAVGTAVYVLTQRPDLPAWQPEPVRPALARCEDCGGACHISRSGRCDRCGSGSVWIAGAHS